METIALGLGSVLGSCLFAWLLWIIAEQEVQREFSGLSATPYRYGDQRSFTPLESYASRLLARRHRDTDPGNASDPGSIFVRPGWTVIGGLLVDLMFSIGATLVVVGSSAAAGGLWRFLLLWYVATGAWLFIKDVLGTGEIGRLGYHLRFLISAAAWPLLLATRTSPCRQIARRSSAFGLRNST